MDIKQIIDTEHSELDVHQLLIKSYYINELLRKDKDFDADIRKRMLKSLKNGIIPSKRISLKEFTQEELTDITNPLTI
jgi:hypothetical protein